MSKLEDKILAGLSNNSIDFEVQIPVPLDNYPWKTHRTKTSPKSDIYLPKFDLYVEVKGFMTYRAVSKLSYLSRQNFRYYIFQGTESEWNPYLESYLEKENQQNLIDFQLKELINLEQAPDKFLKNISNISLLRLKNYISIKIDEYKDWNGEWY